MNQSLVRLFKCLITTLLLNGLVVLSSSADTYPQGVPARNCVPMIFFQNGLSNGGQTMWGKRTFHNSCGVCVRLKWTEISACTNQPTQLPKYSGDLATGGTWNVDYTDPASACTLTDDIEVTPCTVPPPHPQPNPGPSTIPTPATPQAPAAPIDGNLALPNFGAVFVASSSEIGIGNANAMRDNLVRDLKAPWLPNGDISFIFGRDDQSQSVTINLGTPRAITCIAANVDIEDRPVTIPGFKAKVSDDGSVWRNWSGTTVYVHNQTTPKTALIISCDSRVVVQHIEYEFGAAATKYGNGGSRLYQVYAW